MTEQALNDKQWMEVTPGVSQLEGFSSAVSDRRSGLRNPVNNLKTILGRQISGRKKSFACPSVTLMANEANSFMSSPLNFETESTCGESDWQYARTWAAVVGAFIFETKMVDPGEISTVLVLRRSRRGAASNGMSTQPVPVPKSRSLEVS